MKKMTKSVLTVLLIVLLSSIGYLIWQHATLDSERAKVRAILNSHEVFTNLNIDLMKPGVNKVYGTVSSSNDLQLLKRELDRANISKCALLVRVNPD